MSLLKEIRAIGIVEAVRLEDEAKKGDPEATVKFAWYAAWRALNNNPLLDTPRRKIEAFLLLEKYIKLEAAPNG